MTRLVFLNFGRDVSDINWNGRGSCTGDTAYYPSAMQGGDIISLDIYPVADYNGLLELVPQGIDNLETWSANNKIIWNFVEGSAGNSTNATFTVIGENRQITLTNGQFTDSFSGYGVHLYQFGAGTGSLPSPPTGLMAIVH